MNSDARQLSHRPGGFTLVEVMVTMAIAMLGMGLAMSTFMTSFRTMYRDGQRLATNANLRYVVSHLSQETLDATEFYLFPDYRKLDGSVDLVGDLPAPEEDDYGMPIRHGDCLVLVTRVTIDATAKVRQFRIYYRDGANPSLTSGLRFYKSIDYGASGTVTTLAALLNAVNLNANPAISGSRLIAATTRGRPRPNSPTTFYPIFSGDAASATTNNEPIAINVEVITGSTVTNQRSSSSFNYTVSPRK